MTIVTDMENKMWNINKVRIELDNALNNNSELELLKVLKNNSFLFYELFDRKYGMQPIFCEISFGGKYRCDFAWLNDNSDGPEWILLEVEKPAMKLFTSLGKPSAKLTGAIEQVKDWDRYFFENPAEKSRIFGAVARFKYILVTGDKTSWETEEGIKWRNQHNTQSKIIIRSSNIFLNAVEKILTEPHEFWSFELHPVAKPSTYLEEYWKNYSYMDIMRKIF